MYVSKAWHTLAFKCLLGSIIYTALNCKALQKKKNLRGSENSDADYGNSTNS